MAKKCNGCGHAEMVLVEDESGAVYMECPSCGDTDDYDDEDVDAQS